MRAAVALARRGLGSTWPNPPVGCVLVQGGRVVGRGVTAPGGRPHAEVLALRMAGAAARGATAYVTLEPCSHHGQTPPCADALIAAGIARVVVACGDPDPRVDGAGLARLREAGVAVEAGLLAAEAAEALAGFMMRVRHGRPLVTLKLATTLDGRIATRTGESRWITGPAARRATHALRARHDAVMVGIGTVLADGPALDCRIPGFARQQPLRIIADTDGRTPASSHDHRTWVLHASDRAVPGRGIRVPRGPGGLDLKAALQALGAAGLTRVLVEGGGALAGGLLEAGLIDRVAWFHAPAIMGGDGRPAAEAFGVRALSAMPRFERLGAERVGDDVLTTLRAA